MPIVIIILVFPILLFIKKPIIARITQILILLGSIEWIRTIVIVNNYRELMHQPWGRYLFIMASVTLFTLLSGLLFFTNNLKVRYKLN